MYAVSHDVLDGRFDKLVAALFASEDEAEGRRSFLEKRRPTVGESWDLAPEAVSPPSLETAARATAAMHSFGGLAGALMFAISIASAVGAKATVPIVAAVMIVRHASRA